MKPRKRRLMIDCETAALGSNAAVWQIGVCHMGGTFKSLYHLNPYDQNRLITDNTIQWLEKNSPDWSLMQDIFPALDDTKSILQRWGEIITELEPNEVWCKGSDFDFAILRSMFDQYDLPLPWHYRSQCCLRSFLNTFDEFKIDFSNSDMGHNALYDSEVQAECLERILKYLKRW